MAESLKQKAKVALYWKLFEQLSLRGMQFVVGIVMARLLSPSDFGIAALPMVFVAVAQVFVEGGFGLALVRKPKVTEQDLSTAFYYGVGVGLFCYLALFFAAPWIADFYHVPVLASLVRWTALTFFFNSISMPQTVILKRRIDFKTPAKISLINKVVSGAIGITAAYLGYGLWALVISSMAASFLGAMQHWLVVRWVPRASFSRESFAYLWNFGNKIIGVHILQELYANMVSLILGRIGGTVDVGNLNRASTFANLPSSNLGGMLNAVSFPVLSKIQDDDERLSSSYRRMIKLSAFVMFPVMTVMCAVARPMVLFLIGEKWSSCIVLLQIMCFSYMFVPISGLNLNLLQIKGRTDLALKIEVIKKSVCFVMIVIVLRYGLVAYCVADFVQSMFALFLNTYYTGKLINVGYLRQMRDIMPTLLISLIAMSCAFAIQLCPMAHILHLLVGGIVGMAVYMLLAFAFRFDELKDVKYMLKRRQDD